MFLGFGLISKKVNNDPITKQILAQKIIKDLLDKKFSCQINDIETDIHKRFYMKSALEKNGITKTIIDIISLYDPHLSDYIACNPRILNDFKHILNGYINNFDSFEEQNEQNRYKFLIDDVKDYCTKNKIDYKSYLLRLAAEYHILNNIIKYSDDYKESDYCKIKDYIISESRNEIDMNYVRLRKVFNNYLNERIVNKKISEKSDEELLKEKMLDYIVNIDKMSNEDKLKKAQDIYSYITSKPQFESVVYDLLNHTSIDNQKIVEFKKGI